MRANLKEMTATTMGHLTGANLIAMAMVCPTTVRMMMMAMVCQTIASLTKMTRWFLTIVYDV